MLRIRRGAVESRVVDEQVVLLDVERQHFLQVNRTGSVLWPLLAEGVEHQALVGALSERYGLDAATATRDVAAFLDSLRGHGLLDEST